MSVSVSTQKELWALAGNQWVKSGGVVYEGAIWEDILTVQGTELFWTYTIDNQAIMTPENIDAIRALTGTVEDGAESIRRPDRALGVSADFTATD